MHNTLKKLFFIDMIYAFVVAALAVMVPIYLVDLQLDYVSIGLLLSIVPLIFMLLRIIFASIADQIGTKTVEVVESIALILTIILYAFSRSARGFAVARFAGGVGDAGFWATARTDVIHTNGGEGASNALAYFVGFRQLADAAGRISVGLFLIYLSFQNAFSLLLLLSLLMFILILTINKNPFKGVPTGKLILSKIFHKRSKTFWYNSLGLTLQALVPGMLLAFLFPLYFYAVLGFDYYNTAALIAIFAFVTAGTNLVALKLQLDLKTLLLLVLLSVPALILLPFFVHSVLIPLFFIGVGAGAGNIISEHVLFSEISRRKNVSTEIGITFLPLRVAEFIFLSLGGLVVLLWGFAPLFFLCALLLILFVFYISQRNKIFSFR